MDLLFGIWARPRVDRGPSHRPAENSRDAFSSVAAFICCAGRRFSQCDPVLPQKSSKKGFIKKNKNVSVIILAGTFFASKWKNSLSIPCLCTMIEIQVVESGAKWLRMVVKWIEWGYEDIPSHYPPYRVMYSR